MSDANPVDLGIDLADYRQEESIDLRQARQLIRGRRGRASLEVVRRWSGQGWTAPDGRRLVLPAVKVRNTYRTMTAWVEMFERQRFLMGTPPQQSS